MGEKRHNPPKSGAGSTREHQKIFAIEILVGRYKFLLMVGIKPWTFYMASYNLISLLPGFAFYSDYSSHISALAASTLSSLPKTFPRYVDIITKTKLLSTRLWTNYKIFS
jgi:hypothetical protein